VDGAGVAPAGGLGFPACDCAPSMSPAVLGKLIDFLAGQIRFARGGPARSPRVGRVVFGIPARGSRAVCRVDALPELRRGRR